MSVTQEIAEMDGLELALRENPADFKSWEALVNRAEAKDDLSLIRTVYEGCLKEFPLFFGYWNRFAQAEARHAEKASPDVPNYNSALEVYSRGVGSGVPHSVDLWQHYCKFAEEKVDSVDYVRSVFQSATSTVGSDYRAHVVWDMYIAFEEKHNNAEGVAEIYKRVLSLPIEQLERYWTEFQSKLENSKGMNFLLAAEKPDYIRRQHEDHKLLDAEIKSTIKSRREDIYTAAMAEKQKRDEFEQKIHSGTGRSYYTVDPLLEDQLQNWRDYISFEVENGTIETIFKVFERCLIPAANYTEFWCKYADYMEKKGFLDRASEIYNRACSVYVKRRVSMHIRWGEFEEKRGNIDAARSVFHNLYTSVAANSVEAVLNAANFERRQLNIDGAVSVLNAGIESCSGENKSYLALVKAQMLMLWKNDIAQARTAFDSFLEKARTAMKKAKAAGSDDKAEVWEVPKSFWVAYVEVEKSMKDGEREARVQGVFERCYSEDSPIKLGEDDINEMKALNYEFVLNEGSDLTKLKQLRQELTDTVREGHISTAASSRKRSLEEGDEEPSKHAKTGAEGQAYVSTSAAAGGDASTTTYAGANQGFDYAQYYNYYGANGYQFPGNGYSNYPYQQ